MQLGLPNVTLKCCTMSPGNAFILDLKGQRSRVTKHAGVVLCTLVSAGFLRFFQWFDTIDRVTGETSSL